MPLGKPEKARSPADNRVVISQETCRGLLCWIHAWDGGMQPTSARQAFRVPGLLCCTPLTTGQTGVFHFRKERFP